ncbi:RNA-directed DNA polymerase from mobile element jockey [Plakobranchus ocellatus]|uniref:RNA-directed DNA polymerase from mobile element jockey n=1 Tax=Plakobranchus ocellatus TaxID=259542 RepID=A0AAV4D922_9GAST|nr:RNA-directed DNA polymerase from mobile element jockey [Plakobranchus ocellatus]
MTELKSSVNKSNESAAGPDGVYYQFLRHLPESCLLTLHKLFNNIWTTGDIPPILEGGFGGSNSKTRILLILPTIDLLCSRAACVRPSSGCINSVSKHVNVSLFVDDFAIYAEGKHLQHHSNNVQKWVSDNGFRFSVSKTTCVHFHRQRIYTEPALHLDGQPVPVKGEAKFLGVIFDQQFSFENHVKYLENKCLKALNLLRVVGHTDWGADRATLLKLYRTLVRSKLDYGSVIYGSAKKHVLRALDPINNQGFRIALGAFRTSPIKSLYAEAGEPSLEHRRMKLAFNYVLNLKSLPRNPCHEVVLKLRCLTFLLLQSIQGNENVDKLAKAALNRASCSGKVICLSDLKPKMNAYINSVWQKNWDAEGVNKLHEVLPSLGEDLHRRGEEAGRKRETAMCRLRLGHTWLTQSYILKNEQPFCYACDSLYTVRHILIECPDFQDTRRKYFRVTDLYRLFREVNPSRIVGYLKDLGVYVNI